MPCYQQNQAPANLVNSGVGSFATEAECLEACKEGACCDGTTCSVKPQCQCDAEAGEVFKGVGTVCGCGAYPESLDVEVTFDNFVKQPDTNFSSWPFIWPAITEGCMDSLAESLGSRSGIYTLAVAGPVFPNLGYYSLRQTTNYGEYSCQRTSASGQPFVSTRTKRDDLNLIVDLRYCAYARFGVTVEGDASECDLTTDPLYYPPTTGFFSTQASSANVAFTLVDTCEAFSGSEARAAGVPIFGDRCPPSDSFPGNPTIPIAYVDITVRVLQNPLP